MIRFNTMRLIRFRFGSAHHDAGVPADRLIQGAPHPDLRDGLQTHTLSDYERSILPDHQNVNKPRSLYNLLILLKYAPPHSAHQPPSNLANWSPITRPS